MDDTGYNVQEPMETLLAQQKRLVGGLRAAQMFPTGTKELPLPFGMKRTENHRGVFHYNPLYIDVDELLSLSMLYRENEFLELGPYSKMDISRRVAQGESYTVISEYTPTGIEVRSASGTNGTLPEQLKYFERTKQPENEIYCGAMPQRVQDALKEMQNGT